MMSALLRLLLALCLTTTAIAHVQISSNTSVVAMLGMIPQCAVPCVMEEVFVTGGCPLTNAGELSTCACANIPLQSRLSTCVLKTCNYSGQVEVSLFAAGLCEAYPPESRTHELKIVAITTIILSVPFLMLRLYSRWLKAGRLWSDDAFAIVAAVLLVAVSIIILQMSLMGFGLHYWNVPVENGPELLKLFYVCQMLYILVQIFSKVAILALYARLFPDFIRWFQWSVRAMIAFMFVHGLVFFLLVVFQCTPIKFIWDKSIEGKCIPIAAAIGFTGAGLAIMEDFIILLLPIRELWKLQMNTKKKAGLVFLLSVGSFASITSIVRLRYVLKYSNTYDSTWDNVDVIKWSLIEILSACICGNLLPLRPLVDKMIPGFRSALSWYSNRSRKSSDKTSTGFGKFSWRDPSRKAIKKPKLISTLNFTQVNLNPGWDWKNSNASEIKSPATPAPAYMEKEFEYHEHDLEAGRAGSVPHGMIRKTSSTVLKSTQTTTTGSGTVTDSEAKSSLESERHLMPPRQYEEHRISGPWSRAMTVVFDRR